MHTARRRAAAAVAAGLALVVLAAAPASAHVTKKEGSYTIAIGWQHEPTYTGQLNAVQLFVHDDKGAAVDDAGDQLKVVVSTNGQKSQPFAFAASFDPDSGEGNHGEYDATITPTRPGTYTFTLTGSIKGQAVNDSFTSSDNTFEDVKDPSQIEFPVSDPTPGQLAANATRLSSRVAKAKDSATTATTLAVVGIIVAVVLGGVAIGLGARRR
jgi:hypothetical protein